MTIVSGTYCLPMGGKGTSSNLKIEVVSALPATGRVDRIYFVPIEGAEGDNQYTEYVWDRDRQRFEEVGPREIDLTPYATKEALTAVDNRLKSAEEEIVAVQGDVAALDADVSTVVPIVADHTASITAINDSIEMLNTDVADVRATKQDVLTAGNNITIVDNVISATGGGIATIPPATADTLGGIKVGANLSITEDGVLSVTGGGSGGGSGTALTSADGATTYSKLALGNTLAVVDTSTKELNGLTQTGGTLNSELEFTGASGASLKMTEKYALSTADSWEFQIKYKHNGGGSSPTIFGYASGSDYKTPAFIHESGSLKLYLSSSGGSWNLNSSNSGLVPVAGTIYYFKVGFTGSQYYIKYNTTGWSDEFTTQWTLSSTTKVYCSDYFMLMNLSLNSGYYNTGTMYLQDTALIINEAEVWRGANIIPGPLSLNANLDELGNEVNTLANSVSMLENSVRNKQDVLTPVSPLAIETRTTELVTGYSVSETTLVPQNSFSVEARNIACTVTTGSNLTYIDIPINIYKKQVCTVPFGNLDDSVSNLLFGYHNAEGNFVPVFSFGGSSKYYVQYLALNKTPLTPNMSAVSLFTSRMTEYNASIAASTFDKMYFQLYLENTSLTGFITHRASGHIHPAIRTFSPTNIDDIAKITHARYCHNNNAGPFYKADFGVYTTGELVTTTTMMAPIDLSGFKNEFDLNADLSYKAIVANPATTSSLGVVQPDGTTITVDGTGTISTVNAVQSETIRNIVVMTQAEYDALGTKDESTFYLIREGTT